MDRKIYWGNKLTDEENSTTSEIFREPSYVETVNNRIYFYASVGTAEILQLNRHIRELNNELLYSARIQEREPASIFLHLNSYGGSMFDGLAAMNTILNCNTPIMTIVDGCCASAATFISIAGRRRYIARHGFMLIHQLTGSSWGKFRDLQDDNINFNKFMDTIKLIYTSYTKVPAKELDRILEHDLWFDAETCVKYGLVDEII